MDEKFAEEDKKVQDGKPVKQKIHDPEDQWQEYMGMTTRQTRTRKFYGLHEPEDKEHQN